MRKIIILLVTFYSCIANYQVLTLYECPQRDERLGWLDDTQVKAKVTMFNFDMSRFYHN